MHKRARGASIFRGVGRWWFKFYKYLINIDKFIEKDFANLMEHQEWRGFGSVLSPFSTNLSTDSVNIFFFEGNDRILIHHQRKI